MSIPINSVIQIEGKGAHRIVWQHGDQRGVAIIDIRAKNALPELISRDELVDWLATRKAWLIDDPYAKPLLADAHLTKAERDRYSRAWDIIRELLDQAPYIFDARRRGRRLREVSKRTGYSTRTLLKWLRRAWQRGPVPQSLIPDFRRCGGKGQSRILGGDNDGSTEDSGARSTVKRGRPRRRGRGTGLNITTTLRKWMRQAWSRMSKTIHLGGLENAYLWLLATYFPNDVELVKFPRRTKVKILNPDKVPTREQFRYYFKKENNLVAVRMNRHG